MSNVETLRRAVELLRERASKATPGPWESQDNGDRLVAWKLDPTGRFDDDFDYVVDEPIANADNAAWIATMHPLVGLAVADLLDDAAQEFVDADEPDPWTRWPAAMKALAVARAILGGAS